MPERIVIFNVNWLGDVLFSTPFIRVLRETYPQSHIAVIVVPRCGELLETNPRINELIIYRENDTHAGLAGKRRFIGALRKKGFDAAFLLHRSVTRAALMWAAGIPARIGYAEKQRGFLLTHMCEPPPKAQHKVDYFLAIARSWGITHAPVPCELFLTARDRERALRLNESFGLKPGGHYVLLNPGGNWAPKRWPPSHFIALGGMIWKRFHIPLVVTGAAQDRDLADAIADGINGTAYNCAGRTTLREYGALCESASCVVSADSGPMHIAASVKAPVVALFGPTSPELSGPRGEGEYRILRNDSGCEIPCYNEACRDYRCMKGLEVKDVYDAVSYFLHKKGACA